MKKIILHLLMLLPATGIFAQQQMNEDSLLRIVRQNRQDTNQVNALISLGNQSTNTDSALAFTLSAIELSKKLGYKSGEGEGLLSLGNLKVKTNVSAGIQAWLEAVQIFEDIKDTVGIFLSNISLQYVYRDKVKDFRKSLDYAFVALNIAQKNNTIGTLGTMYFSGQRYTPLIQAEIGQTYILMDMLDSALYFTKKSIDFDEKFNGSSWNFPYYLLATILTQKGNYPSAIVNYRLAKALAPANGYAYDTIQINSGLSTLYKKTGALDSAKYYAISVINNWNASLEIKTLTEAVNNLAQVYKMTGEKDSAIKYIEFSHSLQDSIFSEDKQRAVQNISFNEHLKEQALINARINYSNRLQKMFLTGGLLTLLLVAGILWLNNRQKQRSYQVLEQQKLETERQKASTDVALEKLRSAQSQLIQSEKMASLGELTAGIAHEIQNPLNFVNNFSEVNTELISEMKSEIQSGNLAEVKIIADTLGVNMEKITLHGKRADDIVKSMIQHSRASSSQKELTDLNALVDEYLRLSYHGIRAKDKTFNAELVKDFDHQLDKVSIIPQDIGRVLLNIFNNAFYAVGEKKRLQQNGYEPVVSVTSSKNGAYVEIKISDNGVGISEDIMNKIFQPFFTTKPTGQGTGLGLSLSYDIVKAHGGKLLVDSVVGKGSSFTIVLPVV